MKLCPTCQVCYEDDIGACFQLNHAALTQEREGTCLIDQKYRLGRLIAKGAFGSVYECLHIALNHPRAMKLLRPESANDDPDSGMRLKREALTACAFDHPNLVRILDHGTNVVNSNSAGFARSWSELYIVMDLLRGQTLRDFLKLSGPVPLEKCIAICGQIGEGLAEIHAKGIVYRDLKPANIVLTFDSKGELVVKIVDFGSVKLKDQPSALSDLEMTASLFIGSAPYASPESCRFKPADQRSDIYSLGLILYEMIAGRRAFRGSDFHDLLTQQAFVLPPPLIGPPAPLVDLIMQMLSKNPKLRPQTANDFVSSLEAVKRSLSQSDDPSASVGVRAEPGHSRIVINVAAAEIAAGDDCEETRTKALGSAADRQLGARLARSTAAVAIRVAAVLLITMIALLASSSRSVKLAINPVPDSVAVAAPRLSDITISQSTDKPSEPLADRKGKLEKSDLIVMDEMLQEQLRLAREKQVYRERTLREQRRTAREKQLAQQRTLQEQRRVAREKQLARERTLQQQRRADREKQLARERKLQERRRANREKQIAGRRKKTRGSVAHLAQRRSSRASSGGRP